MGTTDVERETCIGYRTAETSHPPILLEDYYVLPPFPEQAGYHQAGETPTQDCRLHSLFILTADINQ